MFSRRDEYALTHQAGGVADPGNIFPVGGDTKPVEVGAAEYNTSSGTSGANPHRSGQAAV